VVHYTTAAGGTQPYESVTDVAEGLSVWYSSAGRARRDGGGILLLEIRPCEVEAGRRGDCPVYGSGK